MNTYIILCRTQNYLSMKRSLIIAILASAVLRASSQLIVDHSCTVIAGIPQEAILQAKEVLHIAYGHTSHGSQVTDGMSGLIDFADNGGLGLSLQEDIFQWNQGGTDNALDLHDWAMDGDVGYWPDWYNNTVSYLSETDHAGVNVIMWSWCGQVGSKYESGHLWDEYLEPMSQLEVSYPGVVFVYMTGHLDYWNRENTNAANDSIRSYCRNNQKVLFDFADIESYSPEGTCYKENGDDACDYYNENGDSIGNWAVDYQTSHTENTDWYNCGSQHSEPLNANRKAYAAWWMFSSLGGWNYEPPNISDQATVSEISIHIFPNPASDYTSVKIEGEDINGTEVRVLSANGSMVYQYIVDITAGNAAELRINTSDLAAGLYFINFISEKDIQSYRLTIVR
jgi:hypothetical protein